MVISLIGFMGAGKSVAGRELASLSGFAFIDLDEEVSRICGRSPREIIEKDGESSFRTLELNVLRDVLSSVKSDTVIALGGGTVTVPESLELVLSSTVCVYLRTTAQTVADRLYNDADRPLLPSSVAGIGALMAARESIYSRAHITVDTDGLSPSEVASAVAVALQRHPASVDAIPDRARQKKMTGA